jgi:Co/Zn/Cd efflux system component
LAATGAEHTSATALAPQQHPKENSMDLKAAIQKITDEYVTPVGETADPAKVVEEARTLMPSVNGCHDEIDYWQLEDEDLATAYHTVVDARDAEIAAALAEITKTASHLGL